jgi:hypothetical protein
MKITFTLLLIIATICGSEDVVKFEKEYAEQFNNYTLYKNIDDYILPTGYNMAAIKLSMRNHALIKCSKYEFLKEKVLDVIDDKIIVYVEKRFSHTYEPDAEILKREKIVDWWKTYKDKIDGRIAYGIHAYKIDKDKIRLMDVMIIGYK